MPRLLALIALGLGPAWTACRSTPSVEAPASRAKLATFPGDTWQRVADPTRLGWSKEGLDSVHALISRMSSSAMVVVDRGRIVYSYGDLTAQSYLASVRKSILSMLYGIEIARGKIDTSKTLAELGIDDHGGLLPAEREATVQDLLGARSGVYHIASNAGDFLAEAPPRGSQKHGTYQLYSNWDFTSSAPSSRRRPGATSTTRSSRSSRVRSGCRTSGATCRRRPVTRPGRSTSRTRFI